MFKVILWASDGSEHSDRALDYARKLAEAESAELVAAHIANQPYDALHVWQRDLAAPGHRGFEPGLTPLALEAAAAIRHHLPEKSALATAAVNEPARSSSTASSSSRTNGGSAFTMSRLFPPAGRAVSFRRPCPPTLFRGRI